MDKIVEQISSEREPLTTHQIFNLYSMLDQDVTDLLDCLKEYKRKRSLDSIYSSVKVLSMMTMNSREGSIMSPTKKKSKYNAFKSLITFLKDNKKEINDH